MPKAGVDSEGKALCHCILALALISCDTSARFQDIQRPRGTKPQGTNGAGVLPVGTVLLFHFASAQELETSSCSLFRGVVQLASCFAQVCGSIFLCSFASFLTILFPLLSDFHGL